MPKRKLDDPSGRPNKRVKITADSVAQPKVDAAVTVGPSTAASTSNEAGPSSAAKHPPMTQSDSKTPQRPRIRKLIPPRPYPTVPTSSSATGPRSAHKEGSNVICITRKTKLALYMRRCKDLIIQDGYKTLHLSAMGAAIPHLLRLSAALPPILPFSKDEIRLELITGTVEVQDEVMPEDEDEDISLQTRGKSTLTVVFKIGDGEFEGNRKGSWKKNGGRSKGNRDKGKGLKDKAKAKQDTSGDIILGEPEQEDLEML